MALSYLDGEYLQSLVEMETYKMDLKHFNERSGTGDGRVWSSTQAKPLWYVEFSLIEVPHEEARRINAAFRHLIARKEHLLWTDPTQPLNFFGSITGATISAINSTRDKISLAGLPPFTSLNLGDHLSVAWGTDRQYLAELGDDAIADAAGVISNIPVTPYTPLGVPIGSTVELDAPKAKMFIEDSGFTPYNFRSVLAGGASVRMLQRP